MTSLSMPLPVRDQTPRQRRLEKERLNRATAAEQRYGRLLRTIARQVGQLINAVLRRDSEATGEVERLLKDYGTAIAPWARAVARRMLAEVNQRDQYAWARLSKELARGIHREVRQAPTGKVFRELQEEQVGLITSLPIEAADRVHKLAMEGLEQGTRASEIAKKIMETGEITRARATMIARTEVGRTKLNLTRARAEFVGSEGYIWRTSMDSDVRPSHKGMEGKMVAWDAPPTLDNLTGHAGALPNCRCWPEVIIPEELR